MVTRMSSSPSSHGITARADTTTPLRGCYGRNIPRSTRPGRTAAALLDPPGQIVTGGRRGSARHFAADEVVEPGHDAVHFGIAAQVQGDRAEVADQVRIVRRQGQQGERFPACPGIILSAIKEGRQLLAAGRAVAEVVQVSRPARQVQAAVPPGRVLADLDDEFRRRSPRQEDRHAAAVVQGPSRQQEHFPLFLRPQRRGLRPGRRPRTRADPRRADRPRRLQRADPRPWPRPVPRSAAPDPRVRPSRATRRASGAPATPTAGPEPPAGAKRPGRAARALRPGLPP